MVFNSSGSLALDVQAPADDWFTLSRFASILALLIVATFPDCLNRWIPEVILGQSTFFYRDFGIFGYPLAHYYSESFWRGEIPLWNPLNNCGLPFLAQWNTMVLYPPSLFYLLLPLSWSLGVFCLLHLFLAGVGMYLLANSWVRNRLAASVAGVAFAFNGLTWHALMWPNNIAALSWMPLVVLTVQRAWREGRKQVVLAGVVAAMQMLAGAPEIIFLTWLLLATLCASEILQLREKKLQFVRHVVMRCGLVIALVAGLAAAQLLPFFDLLMHSQRDVGFGDTEWAMPVSGLANLLVPLFRCARSFHGVFVQPGQLWTTSYYPGIGVVLLGLLAIWRVREPQVWLWTGVCVVSVLLALGDQGFLYGVLRTLAPQLGFMRFPIKFVVVLTFILPLLAAYAVSWFRVLPEADRTFRTSELIAVSLFLLGLMSLIIVVALYYPHRNENSTATWQNAAVRMLFLALSTGALVGLHHLKRTRWQWVLCFGLLLALWFDVRTHAPNLNPTVERSVYEPGLVRAATKLVPDPKHGDSRVMVSSTALAQMRHLSVATPKDEMLGRRLALYGNCNLLDDIPKLNGFYSLYLRETDEVLSLLYPSPKERLPRLVDFLNVSHVTAPDSLLEWAARPSFLPLATVGQKPLFADAPATLQAFHDPTFDPRSVVYLPLEAASFIKATNRTTATIVSSRFTAHRAEIQVDASEASILVVAQAYYHPWKAYVDGAPVRLWRANYAFQALEVPAGQHAVTLAYEDSRFRQGAFISGITLVACALAWFRQRKMQRISPSSPGE